ncbi:MAG TPA: helix-turn-helix transcriptional regulator [Candidatus Limiplasma sp.]|nr:helix-turn-helix transcriptional regulator [Candidatus Limiplasma sp.]
MNIGDRIKQIRKVQGNKMTQTDLGQRLGVPREVITSYEIGRVIPPEPTLRLICREFGVDYDWLKYGTGEMYGADTDATLAELDDLMTSEEHPATRAMISALAGMSSAELDVIDALITRIKKELG